jgi:hypothetical protein
VCLRLSFVWPIYPLSLSLSLFLLDLHRTSINTCFHSLLGDKGSRVRASAPSVVKVIVNCGRITNDGLALMKNKKQHFRRVENGDWDLKLR